MSDALPPLTGDGAAGARDEAVTLVALLPRGSEPDVVARIYATVDVDRVLAGLGDSAVAEPLADDPLLGAIVRLVQPVGEVAIALLEPRTEWRLAATLARWGEGYAGRYVVVTDGLPNAARRAAAAGIPLSREEEGPFGRSVLVLNGSPTGPHLILVERPTGTIGR